MEVWHVKILQVGALEKMASQAGVVEAPTR